MNINPEIYIYIIPVLTIYCLVQNENNFTRIHFKRFILFIYIFIIAMEEVVTNLYYSLYDGIILTNNIGS